MRKYNIYLRKEQSILLVYNCICLKNLSQFLLDIKINILLKIAIKILIYFFLYSFRNKI